MRHEQQKLPRGVSFDRQHRGSKKYKARVFVQGKDRYLGRFETAAQASRAYEQAAAAFRSCSPASASAAEDPAFLERVRAHIAQEAAAQEAPEQQVTPSSSSHAASAGQFSVDTDQVVKLLTDDDAASTHSLLPEQRSLLMAQASAQTSGSGAQDGLYELEAAAAFAAAIGAELVQGAGSLPLSHSNGPSDLATFSAGWTDQQVEDAMAREVLQALSDWPPAADTGAQPASSTVPTTQSLQQQQQQQQQQPRSCTPDPLAAAHASIASLSAALAQQQQLLPAAAGDLQQLLQMVLEGATQVEEGQAAAAASAVPTADLANGSHPDMMQRACSEFLAATAATMSCSVRPAADAMPAASTPTAACSAQQQLQQTCSAGMLPAVPSAHTVAASLAASSSRPVSPAAPAAAAVPHSLVRQDSLLLQSSSCLDAVLYIAAVVRAVLDLYTTMLHKLFEEDAGADLIHWLPRFRQQQQQQQQLSAQAASALSPGAAAAAASAAAAATLTPASLEALSSSVMQVMAKMVHMLVTSSTSAAAAAEAAAAAGNAAVCRTHSTADDGISSLVPGAAAGAVALPPAGSSPAPLAQRSFVMAALERFNAYLVRLYKSLQQQQRSAGPGPALWQEVSLWLQQLQAQAVTAEDRMAVQLATLL